MANGRFESSDDEELMIKALHVEDEEVDMDTDIPPTTGNEYLRRVRNEAKHCKKIVVANLDTSKFISHQTVQIPNSSGYHPPPKGCAPLIEWQQDQVSTFSVVRTKFASQKMKTKQSDSKHSMKLPQIENSKGWLKFCYGETNNNRINESTDAPFESHGTPPLLSIISNMSQNLIIQILDYHKGWLKQKEFSDDLGQWIYALLVALEKPLTPEVCSSLRDLARICCDLRTTVNNPEDPRLKPFNLFICLVARYFEQGDLADT